MKPPFYNIGTKTRVFYDWPPSMGDVETAVKSDDRIDSIVIGGHYTLTSVLSWCTFTSNGCGLVNTGGIYKFFGISLFIDTDASYRKFILFLDKNGMVLTEFGTPPICGGV